MVGNCIINGDDKNSDPEDETIPIWALIVVFFFDGEIFNKDIIYHRCQDCQ